MLPNEILIEHICPRLMLLDEDYIYFKILYMNYTYTNVLWKGRHHTSWDMDQVLGIPLNVYELWNDMFEEERNNLENYFKH